MRNYRFIALVIILYAPCYLAAQKIGDTKFGTVTAANFVVNSPIVDSNANAVVLEDIGSSYFEGNTKGEFSLIFKRIRRVKILSKNGFDAADVAIPLYTDGKSEEKLEDCKGITYNLEGNNVVSTKLDPKSIFTEKTSKNWITAKFAMPAIKVGSIIEYTYTINSEFYQHIYPWYFQSQYPCLKSIFTVAIPDFFKYVFLGQSYLDIKKESKTSYRNFSMMKPNTFSAADLFRFDADLVETKWTATDIPALKEEPYTSAVKNYLSKIEFQLSHHSFPGYPTEEILGTWKKLRERLMKGEYFGADINKPNLWLNDEMKNILTNAKTQIDTAKQIYMYVRDNFSVTNENMYRTDNLSLKDIFKQKSGTVGDINLLLTAMLKHVKITAYPVILSTRKNGFSSEIYPIIERFNYVICAALIGEDYIGLDAAVPRLGFGKLPLEVYNGHARLLVEDPLPIYFDAGSLAENSNTILYISNRDSGGMTASFTENLGYYASLDLRNKLAKSSQKDYFKSLEKDYENDTHIFNETIDSLSNYEAPVQVKYDFNFELGDEDLIYFTPLFYHRQKENPFKSAERKYPVEMPYVSKDVYVLNMDIPKGYKVEEMPKSVRVKLNEDEGMFEFLVSVDQVLGAIQLTSKIELKKALYTPEDYETLRNFFALIVKKQNEQIVFKKIK